MQTGTFRHILCFALVTQLACCDDDDAATCSASSDCVLVARDCCSSGDDKLEGVYAARADSSDAKEGPAECRGKQLNCPVRREVAFDSLAPNLRAACVANRCTAIDLRKDEASRCTRDSDCHTQSAGCCPPCSSDPLLYASVNTSGASLLACFPIPPCDACISTDEPQSYCASDGHCALRR